jgi:hypothetical protein
MKEYKIYLTGCDDETIITIKLSEEEFLLIKKICDKSEIESTYGCMPTMRIDEENLFND